MSDTSSADMEKRLYAEWEEQGCFEAGRVDVILIRLLFRRLM